MSKVAIPLSEREYRRITLARKLTEAYYNIKFNSLSDFIVWLFDKYLSEEFTMDDMKKAVEMLMTNSPSSTT